MTSKPARKAVDWELIERDFRAGIKTLRKIAEEHGITHGAINKRAKLEGWDRDLQAKIKAKVEAKVSKAAVSNLVSKDQLVTEREIVEANANAISAADLTNRSDVLLALDTSRLQLQELAELGKPEFRQMLLDVGEVMDQSYTTRTGAEIKDKQNELYRYIISLAGRVKMAKDVAGALGVYIPMQRKILKLDADADKAQTEVDKILREINAAP